MKSKKIMKYIIIATVLLIPIMYSFFYLKAYWDPYGNLTDIKIAMVNLDEGNNTENQGQQFIETMVENGTFNICDVSLEEAENGLKDGKYYAMIKIPSTFTVDLNSAKEENKVISKITYSPNQKTNYLASQIINSAVKTIEINLQAKVSKTVTENLVYKLNGVPDSLQEISDGSEEILNGTNKLEDGAKELTDGTQELNTSYTDFDNGIISAYTGSLSVDDGVKTLGIGADTLINGVSTLKEGTVDLDNGITSVNDGASALLSGATQLDEGVFSLSEGTKSLTVGASTVSSGASEIEGYLEQLYSGIQNLKNGYVSIDSGINNIIVTLGKLKSSMNTLSVKSTELSKLKISNETAINSLKSKNSTIKSNYDKYFANYLGNKDLSKVTNEEINEVAKIITSKYAESLGSESSAIGATYGALFTTWKDTYIGNLSLIQLTQSNLEAVKTILNLLQSEDLISLVSDDTTAKLTALKNGSTTVSEGLIDLEISTSQIYSGTKKLSQGIGSLVVGADKVNTGAKELKLGTNSLKTGTKNLANGTTELKVGSSALVLGANTLVDGGTQMTNGIRTLKNGTSSLKDGLNTLSLSSTKVRTGISSIDRGTLQLFDGIGILKTGTITFNKEINSGLNGTKQELTKLNGLAEFIENPIEIEEVDYGKIGQYGIAFTPLFLSIGLWVGVLMAYVVLYYDQEKRFKLLGKYADNKYLQIGLYFIISILQGIVTGFLLKVGLSFNVTNTILYYFTCIFVSMVFMSIVQFLIMNFGDVGKFLALVILVLQLAASGGTFPLQTVAKCFQGMNSFLPMTYSIKLIKESIVSIDSGFAIKNIIILSIYGIISLVITLIVQKIKNQKKVS